MSSCAPGFLSTRIGRPVEVLYDPTSPGIALPVRKVRSRAWFGPLLMAIGVAIAVGGTALAFLVGAG